MTLNNFLDSNVAAPVRRGDLVFHIADPATPGRWRPRQSAHAGIAAVDVATYSLHTTNQVRVAVYHMTCRIERHEWFLGSDQASCINLSGVVCENEGEIDDAGRDSIIDVALAYYHHKPSALNFYFMGEPNAACANQHPFHPAVRPGYGFSCSTFVHYCYEQGTGIVLVSEEMPVLTESQRDELTRMLEHFGLAGQMQQGLFRRLFTSYLMGAALLDDYPFMPSEWSIWQHHCAFIPPGAFFH